MPGGRGSGFSLSRHTAEKIGLEPIAEADMDDPTEGDMIKKYGKEKTIKHYKEEARERKKEEREERRIRERIREILLK